MTSAGHRVFRSHLPSRTASLTFHSPLYTHPQTRLIWRTAYHRSSILSILSIILSILLILNTRTHRPLSSLMHQYPRTWRSSAGLPFPRVTRRASPLARTPLRSPINSRILRRRLRTCLLRNLHTSTSSRRRNLNNGRSRRRRRRSTRSPSLTWSPNRRRYR